MGSIRQHSPVLLILAAFSRHSQALNWARDQAQREWGKIALESEPFEFRETEYYTATMGPDLRKIFFSFQNLIDPTDIATLKKVTNQWEERFQRTHDCGEPRPLNLDPGYISEAKLILASTKDHSHRIHLRDGIYAEITLHYQQGNWRELPWTFPDFRRDDYREFFRECRKYLRTEQKKR